MQTLIVSTQAMDYNSLIEINVYMWRQIIPTSLASTDFTSSVSNAVQIKCINIL